MVGLWLEGTKGPSANNVTIRCAGPMIESLSTCSRKAPKQRIG